MTIDQQSELRLLQIRSLIVNKEMQVATANRELSLGGWLQNHQIAINSLDSEIEFLITKLQRES